MTEAKPLLARLGDLEHDPVTVEGREDRLKQIDDLLASIPVEGVLQSLAARPRTDGVEGYWIKAGNRRLATLRVLRDKKKKVQGVVVTDEFQVPLMVRSDDDAGAYAASVAENVQRLPETPVGEFRAFAKMAETMTPKEIAARFGIPEKRVHQRMKLAALHPDVIAALESGKIKMDAAQAFTIEPNPKKQAAYLKKAQSWDLHAVAIRQALTQKLIRGDSVIARAIGKDAYVAAGGNILGDAVDERASYWTSDDIVARLAEERMAEQKTKWLEEGWSFVETASEFCKGAPTHTIWNNRIDAVGPLLKADAAEILRTTQNRMSELEKQYPSLEDEYDESVPDEVEQEYRRLADELDTLEYEERAYTAEQKAIAGVVYWPDLSQDPQFGIVRDGVEVPAELGGGDGSDERDPADQLRDPGYEVETLIADMVAKGLALKITADTTLALRVLLAQMRLGNHWGGVLGLSMSFKVKHKVSDFTEAWASVRDMESPALISELVAGIAAGLKISRSVDTGTLLEDAGARPVFAAKPYFAKLSKPQLRTAWRDMRSVLDADFVELPDEDLKKMAKSVAALAEKTGWLPPQIRTSTYAGPKFVTGDEPVAEGEEEQQLQAAE